MKTEDDFFNDREWLRYQQEMEAKAKAEAKAENPPIETLPLKKVNELLNLDPRNQEAIERRSQLLKTNRAKRVSQVKQSNSNVIEKIKSKLSGGK